MNCRQARQRIRERLDGTLEREDRARLDEHLEKCPRCRRDLATLSTAVGWLEDLEPARVPLDFGDDVMRRVREHRARAERKLSWGEMLRLNFGRYSRPAMAGLVLVVIAAVLGPALVQVSSDFVTPRLAEPLAKGTVRLVEMASDPEEIEAISDRAKEVTTPISLVGRSVYRSLLGLVVPIALWCSIGVAGVGFVWWVSRYSMQRRTGDAHLVS